MLVPLIIPTFTFGCCIVRLKFFCNLLSFVSRETTFAEDLSDVVGGDFLKIFFERGNENAAHIDRCRAYEDVFVAFHEVTVRAMLLAREHEHVPTVADESAEDVEHRFGFAFGDVEAVIEAFEQGSAIDNCVGFDKEATVRQTVDERHFCRALGSNLSFFGSHNVVFDGHKSAVSGLEVHVVGS